MTTEKTTTSANGAPLDQAVPVRVEQRDAADGEHDDVQIGSEVEPSGSPPIGSRMLNATAVPPTMPPSWSSFDSTSSDPEHVDPADPADTRRHLVVAGERGLPGRDRPAGQLHLHRHLDQGAEDHQPEQREARPGRRAWWWRSARRSRRSTRSGSAPGRGSGSWPASPTGGSLIPSAVSVYGSGRSILGRLLRAFGHRCPLGVARRM